MAKKSKNDYGIYEVKGGSFVLVKGGFSNSYECEKWLRNEVKKSGKNVDDRFSGEFAIMSVRRKFTLSTKTQVSVKFVPWERPTASRTASDVRETEE